ncbi:MAG TPA: SMC-Scp complex subunit ScpB, partial [Allosphingosinicella sp.]
MDDSLRAVEAVLFAAEEPMGAEDVAAHVGPEVDVAYALAELVRHYDGRGIELVERGGRCENSDSIQLLRSRRSVSPQP